MYGVSFFNSSIAFWNGMKFGGLTKESQVDGLVSGWVLSRGEHITWHRFVPIDAIPGKMAYLPPLMPPNVMATCCILASEEWSMHNTRSLTLLLIVQQHLLCFVLPVLLLSLLFGWPHPCWSRPSLVCFVFSYIILYSMLQTLQHAFFFGVLCFKLCKFWRTFCRSPLWHTHIYLA